MRSLAFLLLALVGCTASHEAAPAHRGLTPEEHAELSALEMPVLLPAAPLLAQRVSIITGADWYVVNVREGDHGFLLQGNARAHMADPAQVPPAPSTEEVRGHDARFEVNEGVRHVTWNEDGVDYSLTIECMNPFENPHCTETDYARSVAESLVRFGGVR